MSFRKQISPTWNHDNAGSSIQRSRKGIAWHWIALLLLIVVALIPNFQSQSQIYDFSSSHVLYITTLSGDRETQRRQQQEQAVLEAPENSAAAASARSQEQPTELRNTIVSDARERSIATTTSTTTTTPTTTRRTATTDFPTVTEWTVVVASNNAFYDVFLNWLGYFFKLNMKNKLIFVAEDDKVYKRAKLDFAKNPQIRVERSRLQLDDPNFHYKDRSDLGYKLMMSSRPTTVKRFLDEGLNVLFSDADIIWFQNPIPHLVDKNGNSNYDIHFQRDGAVKVCGGFFGMLSNNRTRELVSAWESVLLAEPQPNQPVLNELLNSGKYAVSVNRLPMEKFPHGRLYFKMNQEEKKNVVNFHANLPAVSHDNKVDIFLRNGLWYPAETISTRNDLKPWTPVNETAATRWTIVVTCTFAEFDFCLNWLHHYEKLNMDNKVILVAMDDQVHQRAKEEPNLNGRVQFKRAAMQNETTHHQKKENEEEHAILVTSLTVPGILKAMVQTGNNVIYSKTDVVWLKNPIPYFKEESSYYYHDIFYHQDKRADAVFGFIAISSSHRTIQFLKNWESGEQHAAKNYAKQQFRLTHMRTMDGTRRARITKLPLSLFPPFSYYFNNHHMDEKKRQEVVVFATDNRHRSNHSRKRKVFKENGLWNTTAPI